MKTVADLMTLRRVIEEKNKVGGVIPASTAIDLIDQAIEDRKTINRWFGFLKLMAKRSSWGEQINELLDAYLFGTESKEVQAAAKRYAEMTQLHDRSINR